MRGSLIPVPSLGLFSSVGLSNFDVMIIFYFVVFCCFLLEICSSQMRDRKGVDPDDRETGRSRGREKLIRINCMRNLFSIKGKIPPENKNIKIITTYPYPHACTPAPHPHPHACTTPLPELLIRDLWVERVH